MRNIASVALALSLCSTSLAQVTLEQLEAKWKDRERRIATVEVAWHEVRFVARGAMFHPEGDVVPEHDFTYDAERNVMRLGGGGTIYHSGRMEQSKPAIVNRLETSFDGKVAKHLSFGGEHPRGVTWGPRFPDYRVITLRPLLFYFRPRLAISLAKNRDEIEVLLEPTAVDERECAVVQGREGKSIKWQLYLDPHRDYLPVRYSEHVDGTLAAQITISSARDNPSGEWVPVRWEALMVNGDVERVRRSYKASVTSIRINAALEESDFAIEYPAGTRVNDRTTNLQWIELGNGKRRYITRDEIANAQDLLP